MVGIVVTTSPSFSLYIIVVFPAASRPLKGQAGFSWNTILMQWPYVLRPVPLPHIRMRISLSPYSRWHRRVNAEPPIPILSVERICVEVCFGSPFIARAYVTTVYVVFVMMS